MKISFDENIKIAGLCIVPWARLGPEQWLPNYAIASLYDWDLAPAEGLPPVYALSANVEQLPELPRLNSHQLLQTEEFQKLLDTKLSGYDLLTYKPVKIPDELANRKFLMDDPSFTTRFENKVAFRQLFSEKVRFPNFAVYERKDMPRDEAGYIRLLGNRKKIVLQDEQLSGGKGTFIVSGFESYDRALKALDSMSHHTRVVVSDAVESPRERSIQCCVTRYGVFAGPLQRQIVRNPLLSNAAPESEKFCGVQVSLEDQDTPAHKEAIRVAEHIGAFLRAQGYRGIFGIDFLMGQNDELFVLEINPRLTGATPLLTALSRTGQGIPFYLLHLLELGEYDYTIDDPTIYFDKGGALLLLHSMRPGPVRIRQTPSSGTYTIRNDEFTKVSDNIDITRLLDDEFIVQEYIPAGMTVKTGGRLVTLMLPHDAIDHKQDMLYNNVKSIVEVVQKHIITEDI